MVAAVAWVGEEVIVGDEGKDEGVSNAMIKARMQVTTCAMHKSK
jgi:hypothetical protein